MVANRPLPPATCTRLEAAADVSAARGGDGEGEGEGGGDAGWWMVTSVSACTCPISCASAEAAIAGMTSGRSMTLEGWMEQELEWQGTTLKGRGTRRWLGSG